MLMQLIKWVIEKHKMNMFAKALNGELFKKKEKAPH